LTNLATRDARGPKTVLTTSDSYKLISQDLTRSLTTLSKDPQIARESKYYLENIGQIKTVDDFIKNDRVYRFAMKALGLDDMAYAKAFVKKVLKEGVSDPKAFANTLTDQRFKDLATTFNFAAKGEEATATADAQQGTVDRFVRLSLEQKSGEQNEGVRLALYFTRKAPTITSTMGILADKALLKVVQTALNIPAETALMDIDKQAEMYGKRINVADFADPKKLDAFISRFTAMWELENNSPASSLSSSLTAPLFSGNTTVGISADVLASLQTLKLGGR
jgi:hypothetical protein